LIYTAENWSIEQANRYYNLIDEIEYVSANFEETTDFGNIRKNYKFQKLNLIWCFIRKLKIEMEVVRILHERMDLKNRIND
jgi:toxin ParE1/3/4